MVNVQLKNGSQDFLISLIRQWKYRVQISDLLIISIYSDGSGSISFKEMSSHLSEAGYTEDVIQKIFKKMDTNKDNEISKEEFRNGFKMIAGLKSAPGK